MKKILLVTTVSGFVPQFEMNNVRILSNMGYEIHYAANFTTPSYGIDNKRLEKTDIIQHQIDFARSPFSYKSNRKAYRQLKEIMNSYKFDAVHCHTPMGGALARLISHKTNTKPVIYTVHGFHFYKGAPILNWLLYYPVERWLAKYTDVLITINKEDYIRAKNFTVNKLEYISGVGVDLQKIDHINLNRQQKRINLGLSEDMVIILSAGELIKRKNYITSLKAFAKAQIPNSVYLICGHGILEKKLIRKAKELNIEDKVKFLGYRNDIYEIMKCSDVFFFPSFQEGLSMALMEAMTCGLPIVASNIRGNKDLIESNKGGFLYSPKDVRGFSKALQNIAGDSQLRNNMGLINKKNIVKYDISHINRQMVKIYADTLLE